MMEIRAEMSNVISASVVRTAIANAFQTAEVLLIVVSLCDVAPAKYVAMEFASRFKAAIPFRLRTCVRTCSVENANSASEDSVSDVRDAFRRTRVSLCSADRVRPAATEYAFAFRAADFHPSILASEFNAASAKIASEVFAFVVLAALLIRVSLFAAEFAKFATVGSVFPIVAAFRHLSTRV